MFFTYRTRESDKLSQYTTEQLQSAANMLRDSSGYDEIAAYNLIMNELAYRMGPSAFDHWAIKIGIF